MSGAPPTWEENTDLLPRVAWARRSTRALIAGTVLAAAVGGSTFLVPATRQDDPRAAEVLRGQAESLKTALDTTAKTAHERSDQIASDNTLRAVILTDAKTVADLVASNEWKLQPLAGETMELFQLDGDQVTSLVRTPPTAAPIRYMRGDGTRLENVGDGLHVVVTAGVERLKDGLGYKPTISGSLAVSDPLDLAAVRSQLGPVAVSAALEGAGKTPLVVLPVAQGQAGGMPVRATVHPNPEWFGELTLVVTPRTQLAKPAWLGVVRIAAAVLAAILLIVAVARRRR